MIDRVGNGAGYTYSQINEKKVNTSAAGTGEKFQLDYGKEGAIYEPSSEALKKQQAEKKSQKPLTDPAKAEEEGVRLTLSSTASVSERENKATETARSEGIFDAVTNIVNKVFEAIKGFFSSIWNDTPQETVGADETAEETQLEATASEKVGEGATASEKVGEGATASERADEEPAILSESKPKTRFEMAKAEAEAFLASAEGKKVARNSDLLTYYDKHGSVISVSPSDRQRILYGDKNQIEV